MRLEKPITDSLSENGNIVAKLTNIEVILFSAEVFKDKLYFFRKKQVLMITNTHIYIIDKNRRYFKKRDSIAKDLLAIT